MLTTNGTDDAHDTAVHVEVDATMMLFGLHLVLRTLGERLSRVESVKGSAGRDRSQDRFGQSAAAGQRN